jgi:hypothetical protein
MNEINFIRRIQILALVVLFTTPLITGCASWKPRRFGGTCEYYGGKMVSVTLGGGCRIFYIAPDMGLWESNGVSAEFEYYYNEKVMDDAVFVDWTRNRIVAMTSDNTLWQLAAPDEFFNFPVKPVKLLEDVASVAIAYGIIALKTDGTVWMTNERAAPRHVMSGVKQIAAGSDHYYALKDDGSLWSWRRGSVSYGGAERIADNIVYISAGYDYSMAIDGDGVLWAWGFNSSGRMGDPGVRAADSSSPVRIMEDVEWVKADIRNTFAIKTDGSLWAWGGDVRSDVPVMVFDGGERIVGLSISYFTSQIRDSLVTEVVNGVNIVKENGSLWVLAARPDYINRQITYFDLPPEKMMDGVIFADGGHAVKTDGSLWEIRTNIMVLPPAGVWTGD